MAEKEVDVLLPNAANEVIRDNKSINEIAEKYRVNLSELGEWVTKLKSLPISVDRILQISDEVRKGPKPSVIKISKRTGLSVDDITWILRRYRPEVKVSLTPKEIQQIVDWKREGFNSEEVARKSKVNSKTIHKIIKKYAPELLQFREDRSEEFWGGLDWEHKSNLELSREFSIPYGSFYRNREKFAPHTIKRIRDAEFFKDLPWDLSNKEVSDFLSGLKINLSLSQIIEYRERFAPDTIDEKYRGKNPDYNGVDWSRSNTDIAKDLGVSPGTVRREREKRKLPPSVWGNNHMGGKLTQKHDWDRVDWSKTNIEIAKKLIEELLVKYNLDPSSISKHYFDILQMSVSERRRRHNLSNLSNISLLDTDQNKETEQQELSIAITRSWYKIAKKVEHSYSWVFINLPKDIQNQIIAFGKEIDEDDLYTKEAENGLETDPHITVKYGLLTEDDKDPKKCIKGLKGLKGGKVYLGSSSIFEGEKYDVVKITVESKDLERIHNELNKLPHEDKHMEYEAHATIAYVKSGCGKKYNKKFKVNRKFSFKEVFFGNSEKDYRIKLSSSVFNLLKYSKVSRVEKEYLTPEERQQVKAKFGEDLECSFAKDKDGYYCYTHRARSDSYGSIDEIPQSVVDSIGSTG